MELKSAIRQFLESVELEKGHSLLTLKNYAHYLNRFCDFAEKNSVHTVDKITLELIHKWRLGLNRQGLKSQTVNYHLIALRSLLKYLSRRDVLTLAAEKIELADQKERQIAFLEPDEIDRLLKAPDISSPLGLRDRAILETFISTGLRISELVATNLDQINLDRGEFGVLGKGGKVRVVFLSESAKKWLAGYIEKRKDKDPALFIREHKKTANENSLRLTPRQIERLVKKYAVVAGIVKPVHPHTLRHTLATDLLINGADLRSVQEILGHASVTTTQIYTHLTNPRLKEIHQAFHRRQKEENN